MSDANANIWEQIDLYLSGNMDLDTHAKFEEALNHDPELRACLEQSKAVKELLLDYKTQDFKNKFSNIVQQERNRKQWLKAGAIVALGMATVGGLYAVFHTPRPPATPQNIGLQKQTEPLTYTSKGTLTAPEVPTQLPKGSAEPASVTEKNEEPSIAASTPKQVQHQDTSILPDKSPVTEPAHVQPAKPTDTDTKEPFDCKQTMLTFVTYSKAACKGQQDGSIALAEEPTGGKSPYYWTLADKEQPVGSAFENLAEGDYKLLLKDHNGCSSQKMVTVVTKTCIEIHEYTIEPHTGKPLDLGIAKGAMTLLVHDKAGLLRHEASFGKGEAMTWEGTSTAGTMLSNGVYLYTLREGTTLVEKGYITIINTP